MGEPLSQRVEVAIQIAEDYLEQTGQTEDARFTHEFVVAVVGHMIIHGERRRMALANLAIMAFENLKRLERKAA